MDLARHDAAKLRMRQLIAELPRVTRQILIMRHYQKMNFEEIGRTLGFTPFRVRCIHAAALRYLETAAEKLHGS